MTRKSAWHVSALIPAHNEEQLLPRCLNSVIVCADKARAAGNSADIVVAVDNSHDQSFELASDLLRGRGLVFRTSAGRVGKARRLAAEAAIARCAGKLSRCWLANTDADTVVPPNWLEDQLALANNGVEVVAGVVRVDSFDEHDPIAKTRFESTYRLFPDGSHPHVHGANLGVRADLYLRAGGWNHLETGEDWDLWHRLGRVSAKRQSSAYLKVVTSGRRVGRAPNGFAKALAAHNPALNQ